jgi:hypothetical protein
MFHRIAHTFSIMDKSELHFAESIWEVFFSRHRVMYSLCWFVGRAKWFIETKILPGRRSIQHKIYSSVSIIVTITKQSTVKFKKKM